MKNILLLLSIVALTSCGTSRALVRWKPTVHDQKIFQHTVIEPGPHVFNFKEGDNTLLESWRSDRGQTLDQYLGSTDGTLAFVIIRNDSILYENYFNGHGPQDLSGIFSVTKSIVSLLTGIAIDEGYIESVDDPVTDYLPELARKNPYFSQLTISHLLDMRAGFKFNEDSRSPFSKSASFYFGKNLGKKVGRLKFKAAPGEIYEYQSAQTALLGLALESAVGRNLGEYFDEKVAKPLGMQNTVTWAVDDRRHNAVKAHCGLYLTAIDLAKIGRLYNNGGEWDGRRIVSREWIEGTFKPQTQYHRSWYRTEIWLKNSDSEDYYFDTREAAEGAVTGGGIGLSGDKIRICMGKREGSGTVGATAYGDFYSAIGIMQQILYIDPERNIIGVRLGEKSSESYGEFIYKLTGEL
ncbi:MAG: beta-lactamase family protein [Rikenellaceae bacterium]|nr:beta-lactamase family protein [Rikenellaceae bacterium]